MDFASMGIVGVGAISIICYLVGMGVKASPVKSELIPVIVGAIGGILGVAGFATMAEFPATDYLTAVAVGIVSGLAATGADQVVKQLGNKNK